MEGRSLCTGNSFCRHYSLVHSSRSSTRLPLWPEINVKAGVNVETDADILVDAAILAEAAILVAAATLADELIPAAAATPADEATTVGATVTGIVAVVASASVTTPHLSRMAPAIPTSRTTAIPTATTINGAISIPQPL